MCKIWGHLNEEKNIPYIVENLRSTVSYRPLEIILVDDGSRDTSWEVIKRLKPPAETRIKGIRFTRNFGKEATILAGLREAKGEAVVIMDADGQHPPQYIPTMIKWWKKGYELVEMVKAEKQKESTPKRLGARLFYWLFYRFTGLDFYNSSDFKLLSRRVVDLYLHLPEKQRFFRGLMAWLGLPSKKIFFSPPDRKHGRSSWNFFRLLNLSWYSIISFSIWPLRLLIILGGLGFLFSLFLILQTVYKKLTNASLEGFPTVIVLVNFFPVSLF